METTEMESSGLGSTEVGREGKGCELECRERDS
jgi:hypothetical protein